MQASELFCRLAKYATPHGWEEVYFDPILLPMGFQKDEFGNYFIRVGDVTTHTLVAHLDTVGKVPTEVKVKVGKNYIATSDQTTILGADDRSGVAIILWLVTHEIPGNYYLFLGEEVGCIGSGKVAESPPDWLESSPIMVSLDRRGHNSVITHQGSQRTASDAFAEALSDELYHHSDGKLKYKADPTGSFTDSKAFANFIEECTNLSVGYTGAHGYSESQDLIHLNQLAEALASVRWDLLPVSRDPAIPEYEYDNYYDFGWTTGRSSKSTAIVPTVTTRSETRWIEDLEELEITMQVLDAPSDRAKAVGEWAWSNARASEELLEFLSLEYPHVLTQAISELIDEAKGIYSPVVGADDAK